MKCGDFEGSINFELYLLISEHHFLSISLNGGSMQLINGIDHALNRSPILETARVNCLQC